MTLKRLALNFILAFALYFLNGIIGRIKSHVSFGGYHEFGFSDVDETNFAEYFFQKVVHPTVFMAV